MKIKDFLENDKYKNCKLVIRNKIQGEPTIYGKNTYFIPYLMCKPYEGEFTISSNILEENYEEIFYDLISEEDNLKNLREISFSCMY